MFEHKINKTRSDIAQEKVPQSKEVREQLSSFVSEYAKQKRLVGPLSLVELRNHCESISKSHGLNSSYMDFLAVLINNELWREAVRAVPYEKRLLLLPKCLRDNENCPAEFDEIGLICRNCGRCCIGDIKSQAEELGYVVLIAEGSPIVMSLIQTGRIEAVIGASCLSVLEKTFPYIEAGAIPALAFPLLYDGCVNTNLDLDPLLDAIYEKTNEGKNRLDLKVLRDKINCLFEQDYLKAFLSLGNSQAEELGLKWLTGSGKRWRPLLAVYANKAIAKEIDNELNSDLCKTAIAVECFHKASLIHDDIEDGDLFRYGQKTLHAEHGIPVALNVGDFLLGMGYSLLTQLEISENRKIEMLRVAADGHRELCLGQGMELQCLQFGKPVSVTQVIDIFQKKTSPAFEVALKLGILSTGQNPGLDAVIENYSKALGIAYQIRDDINDFDSQAGLKDAAENQLSILRAIVWEKAQTRDREILQSLWESRHQGDSLRTSCSEIAAKLKAKTIAMNLMDYYKSQAISALEPLENHAFKGLLRRLISKIFNEIDIMSCCNDYKA